MINKLGIVSLMFLIICVFSGCEKKETGDEGKHTLILGSHANYPPYESYHQGGEIEGFDIDVAKALSQKLELTLEIKDISFDALILALNQGKIDMLMSGMSITASRQKKIAMVPYQGEATKQLSLVFWKNVPPHIKTLHDIAVSENNKVATQLATFQDDYLNRVDGIEVKSLEGTSDLIMELKYGKSQVVVLEVHIANAMKLKFPELQLVPINLPEEKWVLGNGIGIKKNNFKLIHSIQTAIKELKEEGFIDQLEKKWFGEKTNVS